MERYTNKNTEGFSDAEIAELNAAAELILRKLPEEDWELAADLDVCQNWSATKSNSALELAARYFGIDADLLANSVRVVPVEGGVKTFSDWSDYYIWTNQD